MKVRFAKDVLNDEGTFRSLDRIVDFFGDDRHIWDVIDLEEIALSEWIKSDNGGHSSRINLETLEKCLTNAAYSPKNMHCKLLVVTNNVKAQSELRPADAFRCLSSPAYVLVENASSDASFLDAMIFCFKRQKLQDAHTEGWWQYEHLGGFGEIEKRIKQLLARTIGPQRIFVVADSDRLFEGQITNTIKKVETECKKYKIPYAILKKRKIENYLPSSLLLYANKVKVFSAFQKLKQDQKDYYEMKKGFKLENCIGNIDPLQSALYANVNKHVIRDLCGGFGENIADLFENKRPFLKASDIKAICPKDPNEIETILNEIERIM